MSDADLVAQSPRHPVSGQSKRGATISVALQLLWGPAFALSLVADSGPAARTFNLEDDFSLVENRQSSTWSYRCQRDATPNNLVRDGHYELLAERSVNSAWLVGMRGWMEDTDNGWNPGLPELPSVTRNVTDATVTSYNYTFSQRPGAVFTAKPGQVVLHPDVAQIAVVSWLAPRDGCVNVSFEFSDADPTAGNGVCWFVDKGGAEGCLAGGCLESGGTSGFRGLANVPVAAGDRLHFIVDPKGASVNDVACDSTRLWAEITYLPTFDFERDFPTTINTCDSAWSYRYGDADADGRLVRNGDYRLLPDRTTNAAGFPGAVGWSHAGNPLDPGLPIVAMNLSDVPSITSDGQIPPQQSVLEASPAQLVAVSWLAPSNGMVQVEYRFSNLTTRSASHGLLWYVDQGTASGTLADGSLASGGDTGWQSVPCVNVIAGDCIHFIVTGDGQHRSDLARLMANVTYVTNYDFERDFRPGDNTPNSLWSCRFQSNGIPNNLVRDGDYELLPVGVTNLEGCVGWRVSGTIPTVLVNRESAVATLWNTGLYPHSSLIHPGTDQIVLTAWRAPMEGWVQVDFRFADHDNAGGDGVCWYVERNSSEDTLASGTIDNGGDTTCRKVSWVKVREGDRINFIVHPGRDCAYDSTRLSARITYLPPLCVVMDRRYASGIRVTWPASVPQDLLALHVAPTTFGPWTEIPGVLCPLEGTERVWREPGHEAARYYRLGGTSRQRPAMPMDGTLKALASDAAGFSPFDLQLDGCSFQGWLAGAFPSRTLHTNDHGSIVITQQWLGADGLEITCEAARQPGFDAVEWVLFFRNTGTDDSRLLEDIQALDLVCEAPNGFNVIVHGAAGGLQALEAFRPFEYDLSLVPIVALGAAGGRSSGRHLPFWNLESNGRGLVFGVGWSGQWKATIERIGVNHVRLRAGQETTRLRLRPGERIRSPRILALAYQGEPQRGQNLLRRYLARHVLPQHDGGRPPPQVQFNTAAADRGKVGGAAVRETRLIGIMNAYAPLGVEQLVLDAPWSGNTNLPPYWYFSAGTWVPRADLFPNGFSAAGQVAENAGIRFGLWFEPERVHHATDLEVQHPEWLLRMGRDDSLLDLGLPEVRRWVVSMISNYVASVPLGYVKQDFNLEPLGFWQRADAPERQGMNEIRHVEGLYETLDELRALFPSAVFEGCASGGRRIDLESMRRYDLFLKSDARFGSTPSQCHLHGANLFLPSGCILSPLQELQEDPYAFRSAMGSALMLAWDPTRTNFNAALASDQIAAFKALRHLFEGDFYPLLEYSTGENVWSAVQFHREDLDAGCALLFRRTHSAQPFADINLRGLSPTVDYELLVVDTGEVHKGTGQQLAQPIRVWITNAPGSSLLQYHRMP